MIIVTTNDVPGYRIAAVFGETFGLTARSRNIGSNIGAGFKAMVGGEMKGITQLLIECRQEALHRLAWEAEQRGANAVIAFRFETTEYGGAAVECCAYGTAVAVEPLRPGSDEAEESSRSSLSSGPARPASGQTGPQGSGGPYGQGGQGGPGGHGGPPGSGGLGGPGGPGGQPYQQGAPGTRPPNGPQGPGGWGPQPGQGQGPGYGQPPYGGQ